MATPGIQYVINATLGDLRALDQLHRQLSNLRELAALGADFNVRIDPTHLNIIKDRVAQAVAAGVRDGAGRVTAGGASVGVGGDAKMGAVVDELRIAVSLLKTLAERENQRARIPAAAAPNTSQASGVDYTQRESGRVNEFRQNLRDAAKIRRALESQNAKDFQELGKTLEEFLQTFRQGSARSYQEGKLGALLERAKLGKTPDVRNDAVEKLANWQERVLSWIKTNQDEWRKRLEQAERHLGAAMNNQGYDPITGANNAVRNGRSSGAQGFAIDAAAIMTAFEKAADAFGHRLMMYLPEGGGGGGGGVPFHAPGVSGAYGGGPRGSRPPLGYKKCLVCAGSGRYPGTGGVCWRCGGSGDENNPNMSNPELQAAFASGRADPRKVGNAQSNPIQGSYSNPIIPHSIERSNELRRSVDKFTKTYYKPGLSEDDRTHLASQMQPFLDELEQGGVSRARFHGSPRVVNGVYVTQREYETMFGGVKDGKKFTAPNPDYAPEAVGAGVRYNPNDPIRMLQSNVNGFAAGIQNLQKLDLSKTEAAFRELGATVHGLAEDMKTVAAQSGGMSHTVMKLSGQKMFNDERERHKRAMNELRDQGSAEVEAERVKARAQRLLNADTLTRQAMGLGGISQISDEVLQTRIGRGFRRLGRYTTRAEDLEAQSHSLYAAGLPLNDNSMDRLRNLSNFTATRGTLFRDLEQAYNSNPKKYANMAGIGGLNKDLDKYAAMNAHLRSYENADNDYTNLLLRSKQKTTPEIQTGIAAAIKIMTDSQGALAGLGVKGKSLGDMKAEVATFGTAVDAQSQAWLRLAGAQHEQITATEKQGKVWDRFAIKFRDIFAYLVSGTLIYGAVNAAKRALADTMKFESDMAEVQGIFIAKTQAQRDLVKAGVMESAAQYGVDRSQVAGVAKLFAQTGASPEKTMDLTRSTLLASKGAGLDMGQASEMLIAVDNLTKGRVSPADIIDRISRVEARHAVTAQDLSVILQRAGPMAAHLQPDQRGGEDALDMLMGMGTTLIEKTRVTGNQAGTTLKFLMARLSAPEVQRKLQDKFGIMLGERNGSEMRGMTDIFGDIASQYKQFQSSGQTGKAAALLTTFAGARQANAAAALFDDWKSSMDVAKESSVAFGDSQRRLAIQMDTLQTKVGQAGAALSNMATSLIEKSGMLDLLKYGADAATYFATGAANHPMITAAGAYGVMGGLSSYASSYKVAEGATGMFGMLGRAAPAIGTVLARLNLAMAAFTAFQLGEKGAYSSRAVAKFFGSDRTIGETKRDEEMYGPENFDRATYARSDQGKAYGALANRYGLSSASFFDIVSKASEESMSEADRRFKGQGHDPNNPKLARFLEDDLTERLQKVLPGFDSVKDEAEATAEALHMLKESILYGGVAHFAQQGGFGEKAAQAGQEFMQSVNLSPNSAVKRALMGIGELKIGQANTVFGLPTDRDFAKYISAKDLGMFYNPDIARRLNSTTTSSRRADIQTIMNSLSGPMGIGNALSTTHIGNSSTATLLSEAERILTAGEYAGRGIRSLGQALDALFATINEADKGDMVRILRLKKEGKSLSKSDQTILDQDTTYQNLLAQVQSNIDQGLHVHERKQRADGSSEDVSMLGGGGEAAEKIMEIQRKAVSNLMQGLASSDPRMKALTQYDELHFGPNTRERHKLDVIGALNGVNMRAYLKDRVMDEFLRYGGRESEITLSDQYLPFTGASYNVHQERAQNAAQFLQGMIGVTAGLPIDRVRAAHKLSMALRARGSITSENFVDDVTSYMPEGEREVLGKNLSSEMDKLLKSGKLNDTQVSQLGIQLASIKAAAREWALGKPDALFDSLPEEDKNLLKTLMHVDDKNLGALGATASEAFLRLGQHLSTGANDITADQSRRQILLGGDNARTLLRVRSASAYRDLQLSHGFGIAEAHTDRTGMLNIRREMVTAARESAVAMAGETQRGSLRSIYQLASQNGGLDMYGNLNERSIYHQQALEAGQAFKTAVEEAYHTAQHDMTQLLDEQHLEYIKRVEEHTDTMIRGLTDPITSALSDPKRLFSSHVGSETVGAIGAFANQKLAESFMDNLVGPEGIFRDKLGGLMQSPVFQEAALIKMAHIDGIVQGFRAVGMLAQFRGVSGVDFSGGSLGVAASGGYGSLLSAGIGGAGLVMGGATYSVAGTGKMGGKKMTLGTTGVAPPKGGMPLVQGNPNMGVYLAPDGSVIIQGAIGAAQMAGAGKPDEMSQKEAAAWQLATLASVYGSTMIFGGNKRYENGQFKNYASEGAQFGSMIGSMTPLGPVGGVIGGFLGGLAGSLFHRKAPPKGTPEYEALAKIERNTRESVDAITNQTRSLLSPENRLLYSPSTFSMPQSQPFASGSGEAVAGGLAKIEININGAGREATDIAAEVADRLRIELSGFGTFTDSRTP